MTHQCSHTRSHPNQGGSSSPDEFQASITDVLPVSALCELCQQIFEGRWIERAAWEHAQNANTPIENYQEIQNHTNPEVSSISERTISSSGDFGTRVDWVKVSKEESDAKDLSLLSSESLFSPAHHTISDLGISARRGCNLCTALEDLVTDKVEQSSEFWGEEDLSKLRGIVIVRPAPKVMNLEEGIILEISYFVDGILEEANWRFSVNVSLLPCESEHSPQQIFQTMFTPHALGPFYNCPNPRIFPDDQEPTQRSIAEIKNWLTACLDKHLDCQARYKRSKKSSHQQVLPSRLLHVEATPDGPKVTLCETKALDQNTRYATLSHCWGRFPIIRLLTNLYDQFVQGISFESLSKTFQEAVIFTIALELEYIWIDSLCIIQDSAEDWMKEAALMCSVYSTSWVTIAATSSLDGSGGLFHPGNELLARPCIVDPAWTGHPSRKYMILDPTAWERRVQLGPLNTRGWVLQEKMLSPRTIHCTYDQLWWSCADTDPCCNESFPDGVPEQEQLNGDADLMASMTFFLKENDILACNDDWLSIVRNYTQRNLTYGSDKLIALSGVAEATMNIIGLSKDSYLAGFWKMNLILDLVWRVTGTGLRPEDYRAPSWSWASVDGEVYFYASRLREKPRENICAKLLDAQVTPVHDLLGSVKAGHVVIEGPLFKAKLSSLWKRTVGDQFLDELHIGKTIYKAGSGFEECLDHNPLYSGWPDNGRVVYFAAIVSKSKLEMDDEYMFEGLVLERTGAAAGEYHRIGWFRVFHSQPGDSFFLNAAAGNELSADDYLGDVGKHRYIYKIV